MRHHDVRRTRRPALALAALLLVVGVVAEPGTAAAARRGSYAQWSSAGSTGNWTATMVTDIVNLADATATSTTNTQSVASSATLGAGTPFGAEFGSSSGQPYLSLGGSAAPRATTLTFDRPTPTAGWGFALGDIDAEAVTLSATGPGGVAVSPADLGFAGVFNYQSGGTDLPVWDPATGELRGNVANTDGASAWFRPSVPLATLTLGFAILSGSPTYQLWVAGDAAIIEGVVTAPATPGATPTPLPGVEITIREPGGEELGSVVTGPDGSYQLPPVLAGPEYELTIEPPAGLTLAGSNVVRVATDGDVPPLVLQLVEAAAPVGTTTTTTSVAPPVTAPSAAAPVRATGLAFAG